jgi:hypothetical protein
MVGNSLCSVMGMVPKGRIEARGDGVKNGRITTLDSEGKRPYLKAFLQDADRAACMGTSEEKPCALP